MQARDVLQSLSRHQLVDGYPLVVDLEKSQGSWIHDAATGEKYLDAFTCFASWPIGFNHPGMRGIFLLLEATRQLRHEFDGTPRQVADCNIALCHGTGGALGSRHSGGTVILGRD